MLALGFSVGTEIVKEAIEEGFELTEEWVSELEVGEFGRKRRCADLDSHDFLLIDFGFTTSFYRPGNAASA